MIPRNIIQELLVLYCWGKYHLVCLIFLLHRFCFVCLHFHSWFCYFHFCFCSRFCYFHFHFVHGFYIFARVYLTIYMYYFVIIPTFPYLFMWDNIFIGHFCTIKMHAIWVQILFFSDVLLYILLNNEAQVLWYNTILYMLICMYIGRCFSTFINTKKTFISIHCFFIFLVLLIILSQSLFSFLVSKSQYRFLWYVLVFS